MKSGKLKWQRDRVTGSDDPKLREWIVPASWSRSADSSGDKVEFSTEAEGVEDASNLADHRVQQLGKAGTQTLGPKPSKLLNHNNKQNITTTTATTAHTQKRNKG